VGTIPIRVGQIEEQLADAPAIFRKLEPYLNGIVADASRVSPITKELAELTQQEPKKEIVDVVDVLARVARRVRIETPAEIQLEEDYPEEPVWIWAVAWELSDAFWNVAKNGAEAMLPDGGLLSLIVTKVVDELGHMWVEIRIHDAGPKIPEQILSQIFEPFHSTKGGVGYGLWRTQHVVRDLGGSINISNDDNELPNGKTAMFRLPITIKNKGGNA
jgi:nitrogen-specific signal transduction histidine kinase